MPSIKQSTDRRHFHHNRHNPFSNSKLQDIKNKSITSIVDLVTDPKTLEQHPIVVKMNLKTKTNPKATIPKSPNKKVMKRSTHTGISSSVPALNR